ncbi:hypothetical protein RFI_13437 [Reticulomyxa filosa]|uniref:START domain-containing protein n=1 Tax=Reticulomyxa filosa TaxID=46433 RepID=X6NEG8_RETFI|nr:hypothetical protein RFI_13437 [Reticulomyxa filosa]|eukprot:ETO23742.1 hypothetical protein RFI_13437 [Reticulomyxa filosa]
MCAYAYRLEWASGKKSVRWENIPSMNLDMTTQQTTTTTSEKSPLGRRRSQIGANNSNENNISETSQGQHASLPITSPSKSKLYQGLNEEKDVDRGGATPKNILSFHASHVTVANVAVSELLRQTEPNAKKCWIPSDTEVPKSVFIYKFLHSENGYHHYMGKSFLNFEPKEIFDALCDPFFRFYYDKMVGVIEILVKLDETTHIARFVHTSNQCYMKISRESIVLIKYKEVIPNQRYVLAGVSVEHPWHNDLEKGSAMVAMDILASGWVIERNEEKPQNSIVSYITNTCVGGRVPPGISKTIAKKQPFAIAHVKKALNEKQKRKQEKLVAKQ